MSPSFKSTSLVIIALASMLVMLACYSPLTTSTAVMTDQTLTSPPQVNPAPTNHTPSTTVTKDQRGRLCTEVNFSSTPLPRTALASYPGSGNTWARHLIELATGIYTGAIYLDPKLKRNYPGEGHTGRDVVVVKTHWPWYKGDFDSLQYQRVILLIRRPLDAMKAEYKRQHTKSSHVQDVVAVNRSAWEAFFDRQNTEYVKFHHFWYDLARRNHLKTFLLFYDDIVENLTTTVRNLASFLGVAISSEVVQCIAEHSEGEYHRKHVTTQDPFDGIPVNETALAASHDVVSSLIRNCLNPGLCVTSGRTLL